MKSRLETWIFIVITVLFALFMVEYTYLSPDDLGEEEGKLTIINSKNNKIYHIRNNTYFINNGNVYVDLDIVQNDMDSQFIYDKKYEVGILTTTNKVIRFKNDGVYVNNELTTEISNILWKRNRGYINITNIEEFLNIDLDIYGENIVIKPDSETITIGRTTGEYPVRLKNSKGCFSQISKIISNTDIQILSQDRQWVHIMLKDGSYGYIRKVDIEQYDVVNGLDSNYKDPIWKPDEKIILSWEYDNGKLKTNSIKGLNGVDVTSPTWLSIINSNGDIRGKVNKKYAAWAKAKGFKIWPLVNNSYDPDITHDILNDVSIREKIINDLHKIVIDNGFNGINIDFENIYLEDKKELVQFVRELTPIFNKDGLVVSMDVTVKGGSANWSRCFDREELGKIVDYMAVMTYDEHWRTSPKAGSVASIGWVERSISSILNDVPNEKILMGIPFYTRVWTETKDKQGKIKVKSRAVSMRYVENLIETNNLEKVWLDDKGQYYVEYTNGDVRNRIWIEDARSIELKASLVDKLNISGIATWRRGFETIDIWNVLESNVN